MPQSLANLLVHLVFSTKHREPFITAEISDELFPMMTASFRNLSCPLVQIGGMPDHVHVLCQLSRTMCVAELVEKVKSRSSKWVKDRFPSSRSFAWQSGYGAFSIGYREADPVIRYIQRQPERHRNHSFQDEFRALLRQARLEWDERYVWD